MLILKKAGDIFTNDIVLNQFITLAIQKGYIKGLNKYKILNIDKFNKKDLSNHLIIKEDCEYYSNIPIVPDYLIINIQGIDYYQHKKTHIIIDTNDFGEIGKWNSHKKDIDYISDLHKEHHFKCINKI